MEKVNVHFQTHSGELAAVFEVTNFDDNFVPTLEKAEREWTAHPVERYWDFISQQVAAAGYKFSILKNLVVFRSKYA